MRMEFHTFLVFWHQIFAVVVNNFFDILHIHGKGMRKIIVLNISANTKPWTFGNHVTFFQFFIIFSPFLHGKAWCIICHLEIDDMTTCTGSFLFNIKNHSLKDNAVFFCCDFSHRRDFSIFKTCTALFGTFFEIKLWFWSFFSWWYWCFKGFDSLTIFLHYFFYHGFTIICKIFTKRLSHSFIRNHINHHFSETKSFKLTSQIWQMIFSEMVIINKSWRCNQYFFTIIRDFQLAKRGFKASAITRSILKSFFIVSL